MATKAEELHSRHLDCISALKDEYPLAPPAFPPSPAVRRALAAGFTSAAAAAGKRGRCSRTIEVRRFGDGMRERRAKWLDWIKQKVRAMQRAARNTQHATCNQAACATGSMCNMPDATCSMQHAACSMQHAACRIMK